MTKIEKQIFVQSEINRVFWRKKTLQMILLLVNCFIIDYYEYIFQSIYSRVGISVWADITHIGKADVSVSVSSSTDTGRYIGYDKSVSAYQLSVKLHQYANLPCVYRIIGRKSHSCYCIMRQVTGNSEIVKVNFLRRTTLM